jgi:NADH-quinone oxidoreductase subunit A
VYAVAVGLLVVACAAVAGVYALHAGVALERQPLTVLPYASGGEPAEHAWSRYHVRWYVAAMVFLAFDVEMLFMYPWAAVLPDMAMSAVVEMFGFLGVVLAGVVYAWREGAFRWT